MNIQLQNITFTTTFQSFGSVAFYRGYLLSVYVRLGRMFTGFPMGMFELKALL